MYSSERFEIKDRGALGLEVKFCYDGADGPSGASKWFIDAAARQISAMVAAGKVDDSVLIERCDLDWNEIRPLADLAASPTPGL